MEDKVLEIIERYAEFDYTKDEHTEYLNKEDFIKVAQEIVKLFAISDVSNSVCRTFVPDYSTSSATKCKICGKEKWQH